MNSESLETLIEKSVAGPGRYQLHWRCIGISPMHRALIYRLALAHLKESFGPTYRLLWTTDQTWPQNADGQSIDAGVVWIDAKQSASCLVPNRIHSDANIRVLWCWNHHHWRDFLSLAPWMINGVVYNLETLKSWVRHSLDSGNWQPAIGTSWLPKGSIHSSPS